jgi:spore maturation protein CgeB
MTMRILVADTYYDGFLNDYHRAHPELADWSYADRHAHLMAQRFGTGDAYAVELRRLGCEVETVVLNAGPLQRQWALEHDVAAGSCDQRWHGEVFAAQVRAFRPDVLYMQEQSIAGDTALQRVKPDTGAIVGQIACSLPPERTFQHHDLIVSSWPPIVEHFRTAGKPAEGLRLGFDADALSDIADVQIAHDVTFVGGLSPVHTDRIALLEELCKRVPINIFGHGVETLPSDSIIRRHHRGSAWGLDLYRTLAASRCTVNVHGSISIAGQITTHLANNARLYEATGAGPLLITDEKTNLSDLFDVEREIVTFRTPDECVERIRYYLDHEAERNRIAHNGQRRTLAQHTYADRMRELLNILESFVRTRGRTRHLESAGAAPVA